MSVAGGPKLEGVGRPGNMPMRLVLDAGFHDSFAGEMATNKLTSPDINGRFTTGNWWGTYQTNQYNSATYFDIGTIASVNTTLNQVTMSVWAWSMFSFDCLQPQTSGYGLSAGTPYFMFLVGGNTHNETMVFEIYTYNASQNGTQGYINPATGYPAVYDGILDNGRRPGSTAGSAGSGIVSLSATGTFPEMWWGPPHKPNTALVKEVVPNGGRIKGTPCLRIHKTRYWRNLAGDGWAYGPNATGITQGDTIRLSFWYRPSPYGFGGHYAKGQGSSWSTHFSGGAGSSDTIYWSSTIGDWRYETYTWTASISYGFIFYFWPYAAYQYSIDVCDLMYTVNDGGAVPWCNVRDHRNTGNSSTGGWFDVSYSGNSGDFNEDMGPADLYHFRGRGAQVNGQQKGGADMNLMINTDGSTATNATIGTASEDPMFIDFDQTDSRVDIADNADFLTAKTWELWIKFDSFPVISSFDSIFQKSPNWNYADTIGMNLIYGYWRWSFGHHWGGAQFSAITSLSTGVWYHGVGTVDIANPTMTSRTYLNGVATGTQTNPYSARPTNTSQLQIGVGSGGYFDGQIAAFRVYSQELTAAQVKSNFNSQRSKFKV